MLKTAKVMVPRFFRFILNFLQTDVEPEEEKQEGSSALLGPKLNYKPQLEVENITESIEVKTWEIFP